MRLVRSAWHDLRHHRLKNALSAMTMLIGVLSMVAAAAASSVASDMLLAIREQADGRKHTYEAMVQSQPSEAAAQAVELQDRISLRLGYGDSAAVVSLNNTPTWNTASRHDLFLPGQTISVEWDAGDIRNIRRLPVVSGRFPLGVTPFPPRLAVNEAAAQTIGYPYTPEVIIAMTPDGPWVVFGIDAVIADGASYPRAYAPMASLPLLGSKNTGDVLEIRVTSPSGDQAAIGRMLSDVLGDMGLNGNIEIRRSDTTWQVEDQIEFIQGIFTGFSILMLIISAIGILNVGLSSVRERSRELVVRRALGARRSDIFSQVVVTQVMVALVVATVSIGIALIGVYGLLPRLIPISTAIAHPSFPWRACAMGIAAAVATAMLGSASPAWKASRLPIAQALRE